MDQWLETCWKELEVPAQALAAAQGNQAVIAEAKRHLLAFLSTANDKLATRYACTNVCMHICCIYVIMYAHTPREKYVYVRVCMYMDA